MVSFFENLLYVVLSAGFQNAAHIYTLPLLPFMFPHPWMKGNITAHRPPILEQNQFENSDPFELTDSEEKWMRTSTLGEYVEDKSLPRTMPGSMGPNDDEMYSPHSSHENYFESSIIAPDDVTALPYFANGSVVVINREYFRTRSMERDTAIPYYSNGSKVLINNTFRETSKDSDSDEIWKLTSTVDDKEITLSEDSFKNGTWSETRSMERDNAVTYYGNGSKVFINKMFRKTSKNSDSDEGWKLTSTVDDKELTLPEDRFEHGTWSEFKFSDGLERRKRKVDWDNDTLDNLYSMSLQESLSDEAMQEKLETSTFSFSEEKLYRYYETKTWATVNTTDASISYEYFGSEEIGEESESTDSEMRPKKKKSKSTPEKPKSTTGRPQTKFPMVDPKKKERKKAFSTSDPGENRHQELGKDNHSYFTPKQNPFPHEERTYETYVSFTYTVPTPPPSLSESQESWYAAFDSKLKSTLSMDMFQPGNPTWWRGWPTPNFSYTSYPSYHPFNATTSRSDGYNKPVYMFPSYDDWYNYTYNRKLFANNTQNISKDNFPDYYDDYEMDLSDKHTHPKSDRSKSQGGHGPIHVTRLSTFPNIYLTPSEITKAKNKLRPQRGRGKLSKSRKSPKTRVRHKQNEDDAYQDDDTSSPVEDASFPGNDDSSSKTRKKKKRKKKNKRM